MSFPELVVRLPGWVEEHISQAGEVYTDLEDRMRLVIELSRLNVRYGTGGPFAAGVFDKDGRLVTPGVNMVTTGKCSVLHAEIVAMALAQQIFNRYDLSDQGKLSYELVASTEPCAMCFGAIIWSGVSILACGARTEDAQHIGFDEGPKLPNWAEALERRDIRVRQDVLRAEAVSVLQEYVNAGGIIYNTR